MRNRLPVLKVNLAKIQHNAALLAYQAGRFGIEVYGVTKSCLGEPRVARAMLRGGVAGLAESRLENLEHLRLAGVHGPFMLLRLPALGDADDVVRLANLSLNSEPSTVRALGRAALRAGVEHRVILMVDLGDLREGVCPEDAVAVASSMNATPGVLLTGIGTNLGCYGGVMPSRRNLEGLVRIALEVQGHIGRPLQVVSGGNSSSLNLLMAGGLPRGINQLRLGEGILLGRETIRRDPIEGAYLDAFTLMAEVVELREKPSVPVGEIGEDAFGRVPSFRDRGRRLRAILALGLQDVELGGVKAMLPGMEILGASSDHLILDVADYPHRLEVGDHLPFSISYGSLLRAMTSPYVKKVYVADVEQARGA